jgi:hypothetical protein
MTILSIVQFLPEFFHFPYWPDDVITRNGRTMAKKDFPEKAAEFTADSAAASIWF